MLYLLPFILAAIAFLRFTFGPDDFSVCPDLGVISIPAFQEQGGLWWKEIGVLALLCLSFLVFFVADRYKFLSHITVLPAVVYAFLCIGVICRYGMSNYLVAALCVVLAVARLQSAIVNTQSNSPVFGFGLFSTLEKKAVLNVVDAYRIMKTNGPRGRSASDVVLAKGLFISPDIVAVDTAAAKFFNQVREMPLDTVEHLAKGEALKIGTMNIDKLNVKRIKM